MAKNKESQFYRVINKSVKAEGGFYHKIADVFPSPGIDGKRFIPKKPFDVFFVYHEKAVFIEVKYKPELAAFSVERGLSEHQRDSLQLIAENADENIYPLVMLGIYQPRKIKRVYTFRYEWLREHPQTKKDLMAIKQYIDIKKEMFAMHSFFNSIIGG